MNPEFLMRSPQSAVYPVAPPLTAQTVHTKTGTRQDRHPPGQAHTMTGTRQDRHTPGQAHARTGTRQDRHMPGQASTRTGTRQDRHPPQLSRGDPQCTFWSSVSTRGKRKTTCVKGKATNKVKPEHYMLYEAET